MAKRPESRYSAWGAPPGKPYRYRLVTRLADIHHGRKDGRKPIPRVTPPPETPEPAGEVRADPPGETATKKERNPVGTPQLLKLRSLARDLMSQERLSWLTETEPVRHQLGVARASIERLAAGEEAARNAREAASAKPTDEDLKERRIAEADPERRPDRLIRERRRAEFTRRQTHAEQAYAAAVYQLAQARQDALECENALERRAAIARTRAHWIYEYAWRRIATYWQHLVRMHPHGAYLNARLRPVGPELPRWAQDPSEDESEPEP